MWQTIKHIPLWQQILAGFILGAAVGVVFGESATVVLVGMATS